MIFNRLKWLYLIGFFLILALPLLNLPPWFSPPDWGKIIIFRIILSILIFLFLYQILNDRERFSAKFSRRTKIVLFPLLALFLVYFLATIFSLDRNFSLWGSPYRSGGFVNFTFYIIFAILAFSILEKSDWQKIWDFALIIGILVSIIAIFQQFGLISKIFIPFGTRPPSTLGNPIFLAIYLLLLSFLTLSFGLKERNYLKKFLYLLSFLFFILVIVFITVTRAAIIGFVAGFLYFVFFYPFKKRSLSLVFKILIFVLFVFGIYGFYYINIHPLPQFIQKNKILSVIIPRFLIENIFSDARVSGWKVSWQALKARPILGYGPEDFSIGFDKFYNPSLPQIETPPGGGMIGWWDRAHNFVFDISVTAGIPALIIYLLLFAVLFWQLQHAKSPPSSSLRSDYGNANGPMRMYSQNAIIYHGIQASFIGYLVANFFSFDSFSSYLISFLLIAYSLYLIAENNADIKAESTPNSATDQPNFSGKSLSTRIFSLIIKLRTPILGLILVLLIWFIWVFNIRPLGINKEIRVANSQAKIGDYKNAITEMEGLLKSHSFLDAYVRLNYVEIISQAIGKGSEQTQVFLAQKARQILKENIKIQPYYTRNWILLGNYTNVLIEKGEKDLKGEANYYFEKANELSPKRQEVFIGWLKTNFLTGDYMEAKEKAQKCMELNPNLGECWWLMTLINIRLGENEKAKENINIAKQKGYNISSENSFLQLAKVYAETKNYQKLIEVYQELIKIRPSEPRYHSSLATVYKEVGQFEKARQEALIVLELAPELREKVETFLRELP